MLRHDGRNIHTVLKGESVDTGRRKTRRGHGRWRAYRDQYEHQRRRDDGGWNEHASGGCDAMIGAPRDVYVVRTGDLKSSRKH